MKGSSVGRGPLARKHVAFCLALAILAVPMAAAEQPAWRALTPPNPKAPTEVYLDIYDLQIYSIDERRQTFDIGARISASWQDERLTFDAAAAATEVLLYQGEAAENQLGSEIWWPAIEIVDSRGPRTRLHRDLRVAHDGWVHYGERFTATIRSTASAGLPSREAIDP